MSDIIEDRSSWLHERKTYIGGSDLGCILGLSSYKSALDIFREKTTDTIDRSVSNEAHRGIMLEDIVAEEYARRTGFKLEKTVRGN